LPKLVDFKLIASTKSLMNIEVILI